MNSQSLTAEQLCTLEQHALSVASALATLGMSYYQKTLQPEKKPDKSLVSEADRELEKEARKRLSQLTPEWGFVGEEFGSLGRLSDLAPENVTGMSGALQGLPGLNHFEKTLQERPPERVNLDQDTYWMLDPIDGTINFLSQVPTWSTLLALVHKGCPVLGVVAFPALNEIFIASRGHGARWGRITLPNNADLHQQTWKKCTARQTKKLSDAVVSYSTVNTFAWRGIDSFLEVLQEKSNECRSHSDAFGYTRILRGGIDAMLDPVVAPYDVAALQVLFDETPGAVFTNLHGRTGKTRFRAGNVVAACSEELTSELLATYRNHLLETATVSCRGDKNLAAPVLPESFSPTFALGFEGGFSSHPAKVWARSVETAIAQFLTSHPQAFVEDVAILLGTREAASRALSNGRDEGPPEVSASSSFHVRAIVSGGTGLMTGTVTSGVFPVDCMVAALDAAWRQVAQRDPQNLHECILASRDQVIAHCGQNPWQSVSFAKRFQTISELIQKFHGAPHDERIHSLKSRLNMSTEYRWQYFLDAAQQTFVGQVCRIATNSTCAEGQEKRVAYARHLKNTFPEPEPLQDELAQHFNKVMQQSLDLLAASLVPEEPEYDYLAVDADLLGLILHEAIGHAAEGDLIQIGASGFGENGHMKDLEVGPEWMDILVDGSLDNCGYLPVDCEGVLPQRKLIVQSGKLVDSIHTRHTALVAGRNPDGSARLQSLQYPSLNRMTSIWVCPTKTKPLAESAAPDHWDDLPSELIQAALEKHGYLEGEKGVLLLSGWKGGTASCSNLEFRADVARVLLLKKGEQPVRMREANFTGIATECFRSAVDAFGPTLCRSIGTCGKDGQGVLTSDGGPAFMVFRPHPKVRVIGTGDSPGGEE
ncbi:MAG: hypothetical protein FJY29_08055 [Betaproteobacteria bacterium]|nr:hypothetical protein [Betaproteobacteria bacterium]